MSGTIGPANYQAPRDRIRWAAIVNRGTRTIPGFGICSTKLSDLSDFDLQEEAEGQVLWRVYPCAETEAYQLQDPSQIWINGPTPIAPGGTGKGSQDWPLQVLHNGAKDSLPNGYECGPPAPSQIEPKDAFAVWSHGNAFICHSHDASAPIGNGKFHTVWISPNTRRLLPIYGAATFAGSYSKAAASLEFMTGDPPLPGARGFEEYGRGVRLSHDALLWISFSGTLTSPDATEGSPLGMRVLVDGVETYLYAFRSFEVDTDYPATTFRTSENVATSGLLRLKKGQVLTLRVGDSLSYATTVASGVLSFQRVYLPYERSLSKLLHSTGP